MTRSLVPLALCLLSFLGGRAAAQCTTNDWTLLAATGDVVEIEIRGTTAWIAAQGTLVPLEMPTASSPSPTQRRISDTDGLISPDITALAIDGFGNVWVGTRESGVSVFDPAGNHITDISTFDKFVNVWSDNVIAIGALGDTTNAGGAPTDTVVISSADTFSQQGTPEGGGFVIIEVTRRGGGFFFETQGNGFTNPAVVTDILVEHDVIWLATAGQGVWRRRAPSPPEQVIVPGDGVLLSGNVQKLVRAPSFDHGGASVLWVGSTEGLQRFHNAALDTVHSFLDRSVFDVYHRGNDLHVLIEGSVTTERDVYRVDLTVAADSIRIPRADCYPDTSYVPREIAVDASGRLILGTRRVGFAVRESGTWFCPPPLGPHSPTIADLSLSPDGTLYFGTGRKDPNRVPAGVGILKNGEWSFLTTPLLLERNVTETAVWPDGTAWFGTSVDLNIGGLIRYFPADGTVRRYHDDVAIPEQVTQGRNIFALELDDDDNLWVAYGQGTGGGLSVIEWPDAQVTNYDYTAMGFVGNKLLRDIDFDSRGRIWATTFSDASRPGQLYVLDPRGTIDDPNDDGISQFNVANEVDEGLGEIHTIEIDDTDRIWLAAGALVVGQIGADVGGRPGVTWTRVVPSGSQLGGRNPLPYTVGELDWDGNIWLGTEQAGLVRVSPDRTLWTWFDDIQGCPLPDRAVSGLELDFERRRVYVGTQSAGIAVIDLSGTGGGSGGDLDPAPAPNPWRGEGEISFTGIPLDETSTVRVYTIDGELVWELRDRLGDKVWDGRNTGSQIVESGVYLVSAVSTNGKIYEGKVAVVR